MEIHKYYKLVTFVPVSHAKAVRDALGSAGAGVIGNYSFCTFSTKGVGRFKGMEGSNPTIGKVGEFEMVEEERIETVCPENLVSEVIAAVKKVHPYEEVPFDLYLLEKIPN
jgi:hypothetical protein